MDTKTQNYWTKRYSDKQTGWDIGYPSTPIKTYIDQLENKALKILIPGAGNAYEAEYLHAQGFRNVYILDISMAPLNAFMGRNPSFSKSNIINNDFFTHQGTYDLILEQTFFCSFIPTKTNRSNYAKKVHELLKNDGKLVGLWFNFPLSSNFDKRPFGGNKEEYERYFRPYFKIQVLEDCYNSIPERQGKELFGIFEKR